VKTSTRKCEKCGRTVKRSWRTGILWNCCYQCRYLIFIYGPNIGVKLVYSK
jgi:hypothetical protein